MNKIKSPLSNIMKIMNFVLERIEKKGLKSGNSDPLVKKLLKKGFRLEDIDTAFKMVAMITSQVNPIIEVGHRDKNKGKATGVRHLHESEALRLTAGAQQLLLEMVEQNLISQLHFEKVVEYIWKKDLRNVSASRIELLILLNKPEAEVNEESLSLLPHSMELH